MLLNVVIGNIVVTYGVHQNKNINKDPKRNPKFLNIIRNFSLSRDKVKEVGPKNKKKNRKWWICSSKRKENKGENGKRVNKK